MYTVEFYKKGMCGSCGGDSGYHKVMVFDMVELIQLLNYIDKFEYSLSTVNEECVLLGYENFKEYIKDNPEETTKESEDVSEPS
jgi:hypothetical protein